MARECLGVLLMRWLKVELSILLLFWRMSSETAQLYDILLNMASLADVGWKLLEFKARSKRSGLIHLHAWHRTWAIRSSVVLCQWLCEADGLYSLWTRGKIDLSFPFNLSSDGTSTKGQRCKCTAPLSYFKRVTRSLPLPLYLTLVYCSQLFARSVGTWPLVAWRPQQGTCSHPDFPERGGMLL